MTLPDLRAAAVAALACIEAVSGERMELHRTLHYGQIKRDLASNTRLRRLKNGNFEPVPLNLGLGTHYTWIYAGSPPQRASVIVDTGSHLMAFPCNGCDGCGKHTDAPFDTTKSSTLKYPSCASRPGAFSCSGCTQDDQCHISQSYTEGSSWNAVVVEDMVWLGDATDHPERHFNDSFGTRYMFGCQKHETGLFIAQVADGIMGVANTESNLIRKLHTEHKLATSAFALCFAPQGGTMAIGTLSTAHHEGDIQYAAVTSSRNGWYGVTVVGLKFGGKDLKIDPSFMGAGRNVIIDSGTTDSYFPSAYAGTWNDLFLATTGKQYLVEGGGCDENMYPDDVVQAMPPFEIHMQGADPGQSVVLSIPATQLFPADSDGNRCGSMHFTETSGGGVIGANFMMHHEFVFDPDAKRVGFSKAACEYRGLDAELTESTSPPDVVVPLESPPSITLPTNSTRVAAAPTIPNAATPPTTDRTLSTTTLEPTTTISSLPTSPAFHGNSMASTAPNTTDTPSSFRAKGDPAPVYSDFSFFTTAVFIGLALVVVASAYHFRYKRRNGPTATRKKVQWTHVPTVQSDPEERVPLGEEPLSIRGDEEDESDDEFFDSEGYVMSPRSIKRCREAFDMEAS
ncbi:hypothetical protein H310_11853 [Aphanomyces invadans]|uniref:Peptidase A1 domain-containing protein n=1 Tax=Aphanomyces invadans TaxID=157072 RepID=A0A024TK99_9STRA|nr:hypothetical protein H310_11853 [Aphanomyces invadans]ETV94585.1 hypothetical protein H310_11853 [Aphanomyces invadans]|eukprot:XP_008876900.1 hypothetical protein H310_11853 [Aphanomyces invadans]